MLYSGILPGNERSLDVETGGMEMKTLRLSPVDVSHGHAGNNRLLARAPNHSLERRPLNRYRVHSSRRCHTIDVYSAELACSYLQASQWQGFHTHVTWKDLVLDSPVRGVGRTVVLHVSIVRQTHCRSIRIFHYHVGAVAGERGSVVFAGMESGLQWPPLLHRCHKIQYLSIHGRIPIYRKRQARFQFVQALFGYDSQVVSYH